jgi:hypothetical protein
LIDCACQRELALYPQDLCRFLRFGASLLKFSLFVLRPLPNFLANRMAAEGAGRHEQLPLLCA